MYTALVLSPESQQKVLNTFGYLIPENWTKFAHHFTINMNGAAAGPAQHLLNQPASLKLIAIASDEKVMALKIETDVPSVNSTKHVTLAVNYQLGGKPFQSNLLKNWQELPVHQQLILNGIIQECN